MPEIDGWRLCRLLRSEEFSSYNSIPILITSATFSGCDAENIARELGAEGFIPVPYNHKELLVTVEQVLAGKPKRPSLRILVVEDDHDLRETITHGLKNCGYTVFSSPDGKDAYARYLEEKPDIIILDYHLPDNDGQHLLPKFKSTESQSSVILMTGNPNPELALQVTQMGADAYIRKPFTIQYLVNLCEKIRREWSLVRAEKLLDDRTRELKRIIETSVDGIMITDPDGFITQLNQFISTLSGYSMEELIGKHTSVLLPLGDAYLERTKLFSRLLNENTHIMGFEMNWLTKDGRVIDLEINAGQIKDNKNVITGVVSSIRDISARKKVEAELKRAKDLSDAASQAKSEFLSNMSHELRTPLNHIIGFTELIISKQYGDLNHTQEEYLQDVLNSSKHLLSLVTTILSLSQLDSGSFQCTYTDFNPRSLLQEIFSGFQASVLQKGLELSMDSDGIPETIRADRSAITQILSSLISNAIKFTPAGGKIHVNTCMGNYPMRPGLRWTDPENMQIIDANSYAQTKPHPNTTGCIQFSVADNGIGICPQDQKRIFEPFEQVDVSSSKRYQGAGLGLALAKNITLLHGGKLWVGSAGEGRGSTFTFIIPLHDQPEQITT
jgi:PAS domain S-box-containing protein